MSVVASVVTTAAFSAPKDTLNRSTLGHYGIGLAHQTTPYRSDEMSGINMVAAVIVPTTLFAVSLIAKDVFGWAGIVVFWSVLLAAICAVEHRTVRRVLRTVTSRIRLSGWW